MGTGKSIRIVKKGDDVDENLSYYLSLSFGDRLKHLEELRTRYIKWHNLNDSKPGFQRVYSIVKRT